MLHNDMVKACMKDMIVKLLGGPIPSPKERENPSFILLVYVAFFQKWFMAMFCLVNSDYLYCNVKVVFINEKI